MAGKASGTGSPRGRRIRSACSADRFALMVLCASSQAFWTSYHGARPACCSRIPSWDTVNRSLEGMFSPGQVGGSVAAVGIAGCPAPSRAPAGV